MADARRTVAPGPIARRRRNSLGVDLTILVIVGALLLAALGAGGVALYRLLYSPSAFVEHYLTLLSEGRAADALLLPGVRIDHATADASVLPTGASDALLRRAAMTTLTEITRVDEVVGEGSTQVTMSYLAGGRPGTSTFSVAQDGWIGVVPTWRFTESPLAAITLTVRGSQSFEVNGFTLDKRQVSTLGADHPPLDPVPLLVFSPGLYRVAVDSSLATASAVDVLADAPQANVALDLQTEATPEFVEAVQAEVDTFLEQCAAQRVLNPTGCPFGFTVRNRIVAPPIWSIVAFPEVKITPAGDAWTLAPTEAVARIEVDVRSLFDGSIRQVVEDVPFIVDAHIVVLPDGTASIRMGEAPGG